MAVLTADQAYALARKYVKDTVDGAGAVAGKNCTISSITAITGGHRITFEWTLDSGTVQTDTLDVMDGADGTDGEDGVGIASITFKEKDTDGNNVYTVTYTDSNTDEIICPIGPKGEDGIGVPTGGKAGQILTKKSNDDGDTEWKDPEVSSQVQSDWGQDDSSKVDFIKNKPENLVQDADYVHTDNNFTDEDKTALQQTIPLEISQLQASILGLQSEITISGKKVII